MSVILSVLSAGSGVLAESRSAAAVYEEYRSVLARADGVSAILPYLQQSRRDFLSAGTPEELASWFKAYTSRRSQSDVKVLSEKPFAKGIVLTAQGSSAGVALLGRIEMLEEKDTFVVGEEVWYPKLEPQDDPAAGAGDFARGTFTVNGQSVELAHAYATVEPYSFQEELPQVRLTLSDAPLDFGAMDLRERARKGEIHYIELTIGPEANVTGAMLYHKAYDAGYLSMAGMNHFDPGTFGPSVVAGRVYLEEPDSALGDVTFYDATFHVTLRAR